MASVRMNAQRIRNKKMSLLMMLFFLCFSNAKGGELIMDNNKMLCIGRFFLNFPQNSIIKSDAYFRGVKIKKIDNYNDFFEFKKNMEKFADIKNSVKTKRTPYLDAIDARFGVDPSKERKPTSLIEFHVDDINRSISIGYNEDDLSSEFTASLYRDINNVIFEFDLIGYGAYRYGQVNQLLIDIAGNFKLIDNQTPPLQPGFCVDGGMFVDAGRPPVNERFTLVMTLPDHPDVLFSIEANAIEEVDKEEPSLRHRVNDELRMMRANYAGAIHVLERGELEAAGQKGYQVAISAPYDVVPGTQIRKFFWSADGVPNDVTRPFMEVDLTIQPRDDGRSTIHSDAEAKALWEQLIGSLRIRPGAVQR